MNNCFLLLLMIFLHIVDDYSFKGYYKGQAKGIFELEERFSKEIS